MKRPLAIGGVFLFAIVLVAALVGLLRPCAEPPEEMSPGPDVLLVGLDGACWDVIEPLMEADRLPTLQRLVAEGTHASLETLSPPYSPMIWTSIATGKRPDKHGIRFFTERLPGVYPAVPVGSGARRTKALWNILTDEGIPSTFVNWWATFPAEQVLGRMVSNRFSKATFDGMAWPEELAAELAAGLDERDAWRAVQAVGLAPQEDWPREAQEIFASVFVGSLSQDYIWLEVATDLLAKDGGDRVVSVYFHGLDAIQHILWKYYEPTGWDVPQDMVRALSGTIPAYYELMDLLLAELLTHVDPDTLVVVVSDHGMASATPAGMGYAESYDEIRRAGDHFLGVMPNIDALLERLGFLRFDTVPVQHKGFMVANAHPPIWPDTRAFASETEHFEWKRTIILNTKGTYPAGIVEPRDVPRTLDELKTAIQSVQTTDGLPYATELRADPAGGTLSLSVNTAIDLDATLLFAGERVPARDLFFVVDQLSGLHAGEEDAILVMSGPGIRRGTPARRHSVLDITPTLLHALGLPVGEDMDGQVIEDVFREQRPVQTIPSYDLRNPLPDRQSRTAPDDEAVKARLRALGYIN